MARRTESKGKGKSVEGRKRRREEDIDDDAADVAVRVDEDDELVEYADETPAQKRLRLATQYLASLHKEQDELAVDAADLDRDIIASRLQNDVLEHSGRMHIMLADSLQLATRHESKTPSRHSHRGAHTAAVISSDATSLYTASKDGSVIKWRRERDGRLRQARYFRKNVPARGSATAAVAAADQDWGEGHKGEVLTLALSDDGRILASGGTDKVVGVWDTEREAWSRGLKGHRDTIASVAFRQGTAQLFSSSFDRTIKLFDLGTLSYIETLFGHQDSIQHVAAARAETAVSAGGRDRTVRFWKVPDESQLVFRGGSSSKARSMLDTGVEDDDDERHVGPLVEGSIEVVAMVDDSTFLSGGDSGALCLWSTSKKKPVFTRHVAHGHEAAHVAEGELVRKARWITALASVAYGNVFASGSWDGHVRLWRVDERSFEPLATLDAQGVVNSLQLVYTGKALVVVAAVSKEPRLGRWMRLDDAKDCAIVWTIPCK